MTTKGILVNYDFCIGCHSCEMACKKYLELPKGEWGVKLSETGPYEYSDKPGNGKERWEWTWLPVFTKACNMCEDRVEKGKMPMCVQHCQGWCLEYGDVEKLAAKMGGDSRCALFTR